MINPTERARDALCGDRQTSASTTGILLKSELLVLKMLQVCRQSSAISLKPPETMNRINARHTSGWEGNTELGQRALPGDQGSPHSRGHPWPLWELLSSPSPAPAGPGATVSDAWVLLKLQEMWGDGRGRRGAMAASWALCSAVQGSQAQQMALTLHDPAILRHGTNPTEIPIALPGPGQQSTLVSTGTASEPACPSVLFIPLCREPRLFAALPGLSTLLQASRLLQQLLKYRSLHSEISVSALRAPQDSLSYTHGCNTWV